MSNTPFAPYTHITVFIHAPLLYSHLHHYWLITLVHYTGSLHWFTTLLYSTPLLVHHTGSLHWFTTPLVHYTTLHHYWFTTCMYMSCLVCTVALDSGQLDYALEQWTEAVQVLQKLYHNEQVFLLKYRLLIKQRKAAAYR